VTVGERHEVGKSTLDNYLLNNSSFTGNVLTGKIVMLDHNGMFIDIL
jgi:hypothetical protein